MSTNSVSFTGSKSIEQTFCSIGQLGPGNSSMAHCIGLVPVRLAVVEPVVDSMDFDLPDEDADQDYKKNRAAGVVPDL